MFCEGSREGRKSENQDPKQEGGGKRKKDPGKPTMEP